MKERIIIFGCLLLFLYSCNTNKSLLKDGNPIVLKTYNELLKESQIFLAEKKQGFFKDSLYNYIKSSKEYDFNNQRSEVLICEPIHISKNHEKVIIPVLERATGISGDRIEYVKFISGKYKEGNWIFKIKKGHTESFSYTNKEVPTLSETEIGIKVVRNLLLRKEIQAGVIYNEKLFESELYVLP